VIGFRGDLKVLVASRPIDFRRGVHGLVRDGGAGIGRRSLLRQCVCLQSKRKDRLKLVVWDGSGMVLVTKWLEDGAFTFPLFKTARLF